MYGIYKRKGKEKEKKQKTIIKVRRSLVIIISKLLPYNWKMKKAQKNIPTRLTGPRSNFKIVEPRVHFNS